MSDAGIKEEQKADEVRTVTGARLDALSAYLSKVSLELGLGEWDIRLKLDRRPSSEEALAEVVTVRNRPIANVYVAEELFDQPPDSQRHIVIHELLHIAMTDLRQRIHDVALDEVMGKPAATIWRSAIIDAEELFVDRLAGVLARNVELPDLG